MTRSPAAAGVFRSGLPCNRLGRGPRIVVVSQGLMFENRPLSRLEAPFVIGIPNARLILYQAMGHPAARKRFRRDLLAFLTGELWTPGGRT